MVNNAAGADLCATKMLRDMMKDIEWKAGVAAPPEPRRFALADEEVIKGASRGYGEPCCKKSRK